jgi:hypothetical protein
MGYFYIMTKITCFLFINILLVFSNNIVFSQSGSEEMKKNLLGKYPDEQFYASKEEQSFDFNFNNDKLQIEENFNSTLFTDEESANRYQYMYYDDYSEVKKISCTADDRSVPFVNVIYTSYQNQGIFHDDLKVAAFKMEMKKETNYKVKYTKEYNNARLFSRVFFHESYPIAEKTISFKIPNWLKIDIMPVNFNGYEIIQTKKEKGKETEITFTIKNTMAFPSENNSPGILKYLPHLLIFVKSYDIGNEKKEFFKTHADVYQWNKKLIDDVDNKEDELKPILSNIIKNETDSFKIMEKIFYWVQDNVRYIAFEDGIMGYKPTSAEKVCNLLYGDCKGMANLTKTFLKMAGFDARLTWIGTNDIPYENDLPTLAVYNHMICTVIFKQKKYFLDATENYIAINDYAERIQSRPCMIDDGANYILEKIPDLSYERNLKTESYTIKLKNNQLVGSSKTAYNGETKTFFLRHFNDMRSGNKEAALKKYFTSNNLNIDVENISTSDINDRTVPLNINYDFNIQNAVLHSNNNDLLLFLNKDKDLYDLYFDSTRVCDYVFNSKYFISTNCSMQIPANKQLKKTPPALKIENENFSFDLKYEKKNEVLALTKVIKIKKGYIFKSDFEIWNKAIQQVRTFYNSPVILSNK